MKLKFLVLALTLISAMSTTTHAQTTNETPSPLRTFGGAGPEVPFPLSAQVDFPWDTIEGVWLAKGKGVNTLFSFRVQSDASYNRILQVTQLDATTQAVIAEGTGISNDDARMVRAGMVVRASGQSYWLIIRAFKSDKTGKIETLLTLRPFGGGEDSDLHIVVRKIFAAPYDSSATLP